MNSPSDNARDQATSGLIVGFTSYLLWGLAPIFWKFLTGINAVELIAHRIVWAVPSLMFVIILQKSWRGFRPAFASRKAIAALIVSTLLILSNWLIYVYAVITDRILDTSLGYFINPLVFTLLGFLFLGERPRSVQAAAIVLATVGVGYLAIQSGGLPWISLWLAFSFGFYGLIRKSVPVSGLHGLTSETILLLPIALGYIIYLGSKGDGAFLADGTTTSLLLICAGPVTAVPLLCFSYAVRRVMLTTMGFLQYLAPTMSFLLGIFVYGEAFTPARVVAFSCIWIALVVYSVDGLMHGRRQKRSPVPVDMPGDLPD